MKLCIINPTRESSWDEWALRHESSNIFHSSNWARVLQETYGYEPLYAVFKGSRETPALFPMMEVHSLLTGKRGVCLPFADYCHPLTNSGELQDELFQAFCSLGRSRRWRYLEWRGNDACDPSCSPSSRYYVHHLRLEKSEEKQWSELKASNRRNIRKAETHPVEVMRLSSSQSVEDFYGLHCRTRRRQGLPPQPLKFFRKIHEHIIDSGRGFVMLARCGGKWIAGAIFFHFGGKAIYKFGASDPAYGHMRPNNLLMWEAICYCRQQEFSSFSFGRSSPQNKGLLQFKRGWGAEERLVNYYRIGLKRKIGRPFEERYADSSIAKTIMQRLPLLPLRVLGELSYKHLG